MKKICLMLSFILMCLPLAACAQQEDIAELAALPDAEFARTRSFATVKGEVEVPVSPQRIVTDYYLGEFLAVGVKPVAASPYSLSNPFLADYVEGIRPLDISSSETALEMIVAAEPDLIVTIAEADYENFSKIAPTVLIPFGQYGAEELFYTIGDLVGRAQEARDYLEDFRGKAAEVRDEMRDIVDGRTVSFVEVWPGEVYVFGGNFARGGEILFGLWGLTAPKMVQESMVEGEVQYQVISLELLPEYAGDFLFYGVLADTDSAFVEESAVWGGLPPVREGRACRYEQVAFMHSDPITLNGQLSFYTDYFRKVA